MHDTMEQLKDDGWAVLEGLIDQNFIEALNDRIDQLFEQEGESAGGEFKQEPGCRRLANLVNKGELFVDAIAHPVILELVQSVLGEFKLSSLNVRSVDPHSGQRQPLHADMAAIPDDRGYWVCNVLWMLQEITLENGPLRVIPGSHRFGQLPQDVLEDPRAMHPDQVVVTGSPGTIVVLNAHTWHGGMENRTDHPRRAMHAFYCRRDKPQQQYQKALVDAERQQQLPDSIRHLLALDDPMNDRLSRDPGITSGFMK